MATASLYSYRRGHVQRSYMLYWRYSLFCIVFLWLLTQMEAESSSEMLLTRKRRRESSNGDKDEGERHVKFPRCTVVSQPFVCMRHTDMFNMWMQTYNLSIDLWWTLKEGYKFETSSPTAYIIKILSFLTSLWGLNLFFIFSMYRHLHKWNCYHILCILQWQLNPSLSQRTLSNRDFKYFTCWLMSCAYTMVKGLRLYHAGHHRSHSPFHTHSNSIFNKVLYHTSHSNSVGTVASWKLDTLKYRLEERGIETTDLLISGPPEPQLP